MFGSPVNASCNESSRSRFCSTLRCSRSSATPVIRPMWASAALHSGRANSPSMQLLEQSDALMRVRKRHRRAGTPLGDASGGPGHVVLPGTGCEVGDVQLPGSPGGRFTALGRRAANREPCVAEVGLHTIARCGPGMQPALRIRGDDTRASQPGLHGPVHKRAGQRMEVISAKGALIKCEKA